MRAKDNLNLTMDKFPKADLFEKSQTSIAEQSEEMHATPDSSSQQTPEQPPFHHYYHQA
jgi:hypothetical protein